MSDRPCTCHPDDNPPVPCPQKYALGECRAAAPDALENCRLYAARHRKEEWAQTILRFCNEGGATGSPLRADAPAPDPYFLGLAQTLLAALKRLSFAAQTACGTAGRDDELVAAIAQAENAIKEAHGRAAAPAPVKPCADCGTTSDVWAYYCARCVNDAITRQRKRDAAPAPAPERVSSTTDEIMVLADAEGWMYEKNRAALRAAIEQVVRDAQWVKLHREAAEQALERARKAERELAEAKKDAALGKAFRECAAEESFEDGVAAGLHEQGITRLSDAWMAGRQDFIEEVNAAREGA